jgi:hypothetical protein
MRLVKRGILVDTDQFREAVASLTKQGRHRLLISGLPLTGCSLSTLLLTEAHFRITDLDRFGTLDNGQWRISWGSVPQTFGLSGRAANFPGFREYFKPPDWALLYLVPHRKDWLPRLKSTIARTPQTSPRYEQLSVLAALTPEQMISTALRNFDVIAMETGITRLGLVSLSQDLILSSIDPSLNVTT